VQKRTPKPSLPRLAHVKTGPTVPGLPARSHRTPSVGPVHMAKVWHRSPSASRPRNGPFIFGTLGTVRPQAGPLQPPVPGATWNSGNAEIGICTLRLFRTVLRTSPGDFQTFLGVIGVTSATFRKFSLPSPLHSPTFQRRGGPD